jgi:tetratricopeptide (TPR) repeat protein
VNYKGIFCFLLLMVLLMLAIMPRQIAETERFRNNDRMGVVHREEVIALHKMQVYDGKKDSKEYTDALSDLGWARAEELFVDAEDKFINAYKIARDHKTKDYDNRYEKALKDLIAYERIQTNYDKAEYYLDLLRDYDEEFFQYPHMKLARDLSTRGLVYYLKGISIADAMQRADVLARAESYYEAALEEYKQLPNTIRYQGNIYAGEYLTLRDLGLNERALAARKLSREILANAGNPAVEP